MLTNEVQTWFRAIAQKASRSVSAIASIGSTVIIGVCFGRCTTTMKKTIVVVDDHEAVRELFCRDLERSPEYEVVGQTGTGLEAIRLIKKVSRYCYY